VVFEVPLPDSTKAPKDREAERARRDSLREERSHDRDKEHRAWHYADRWPGGRYELHRPSDDSLSRFHAWPDSLTLETDPAAARRLRDLDAQLAGLAEGLPDSVTGRRASGFGYERTSDAFRYNRVQGVSIGLGYGVRIPGMSFTSAYATLRYGFSDERVTGRLSAIRDAPGARLTLSGYRDVADLDPLTSSLGFGNTLNALFAAHDGGDYLLAEGGSFRVETSLGTGVDLAAHVLALKAELVEQRCILLGREHRRLDGEAPERLAKRLFTRNRRRHRVRRVIVVCGHLHGELAFGPQRAGQPREQCAMIGNPLERRVREYKIDRARGRVILDAARLET